MPCRNYNSKRVNILHQDDHWMQNVAGTQFADRDEPAAGVEQSSAGGRCPDFGVSRVLGWNVGAVAGPLTIALAQGDGRNIGKQLLEREYPPGALGPLT